MGILSDMAFDTGHAVSLALRAGSGAFVLDLPARQYYTNRLELLLVLKNGLRYAQALLGKD